MENTTSNISFRKVGEQQAKQNDKTTTLSQKVQMTMPDGSSKTFTVSLVVKNENLANPKMDETIEKMVKLATIYNLGKNTQFISLTSSDKLTVLKQQKTGKGSDTSFQNVNLNEALKTKSEKLNEISQKFLQTEKKDDKAVDLRKNLAANFFSKETKETKESNGTTRENSIKWRMSSANQENKRGDFIGRNHEEVSSSAHENLEKELEHLLNIKLPSSPSPSFENASGILKEMEPKDSENKEVIGSETKKNEWKKTEPNQIDKKGSVEIGKKSFTDVEIGVNFTLNEISSTEKTFVETLSFLNKKDSWEIRSRASFARPTKCEGNFFEALVEAKVYPKKINSKLLEYSQSLKALEDSSKGILQKIEEAKKLPLKERLIKMLEIYSSEEMESHMKNLKEPSRLFFELQKQLIPEPNKNAYTHLIEQMKSKQTPRPGQTPLELFALMSTPFQRGPRYVLLLHSLNNEVKKSSYAKSKEEVEVFFRNAEEKIKFLTNEINEALPKQPTF